jgi:hypothetical protein
METFEHFEEQEQSWVYLDDLGERLAKDAAEVLAEEPNASVAGLILERTPELEGLWALESKRCENQWRDRAALGWSRRSWRPRYSGGPPVPRRVARAQRRRWTAAHRRRYGAWVSRGCRRDSANV